MIGVEDRVLVYPVDKGNLSIVKSSANYPNVRIHRLVSLESWGYEGESCKCHESMVEISHDYEGSLNDCNVVWIVDSWNELNFIRFVEPAIRLASQKGKRIVCSRYLLESEKASLSDMGITYVDYSSPSLTLSRDDRIQEIRTPVAYVMSSAEFCNQFYIETALCAELRDRNYKAILISSCKESIVFGNESIPDFMFQSKYGENEKVLALNQFIRHLEMKHQPEVIIVGVPGAAMPYDHRYSSDFGIIAYEVSESVKPDFTILSSPCMPYDTGYFEGIEKSINGRLGIVVDVHSLSPYALDFNETSVEKCLAYLSVDDLHNQETIKRIDYDNLLDLNNMSGITSVADRLVNKLSGELGLLLT